MHPLCSAILLERRASANQQERTDAMHRPSRTAPKARRPLGCERGQCRQYLAPGLDNRG